MSWFRRAFVAALMLFATLAEAQTIASPLGSQVFDGGYVKAVARQSDGALVVGGSFSHVNGVARPNLARINADGSLDPTWDPSPNGEVLALAIDADGNVYAGGRFTTIGGQARKRLAKLSGAGTGSADGAWNPDVECAPSSCPSWVVKALALDGANLFVGGTFSRIGGQVRESLARVSTAGAGTADATWNPNTCCGEVNALAVSGATLYVGGLFQDIGAQIRSNIGRVSTTGAGSADSWNPGADSTVSALAVDGTNVFVGGFFSTIGGQPRAGVAKFSPAGGAADITWNPAPAGSTVLSLALDGLGNLFVGGDFTAMGGQPRKSLAKVSILDVGSADAAWDANASGNPIVAALTADGAGNLYAGGLFQVIGGKISGGFAGLNGATAAAMAGPVLVGSPGTVYAIERDSAGRTIIGGTFMAVGGTGSIVTRMNVARFAADGNLDAWDPTLNGGVFALAVDGAHDVYAGGAFTSAGAAARNRIAKIAADGTVDASWDPNANGTVHALALGPGGLHAGGEFTSIGGASRNYIARLATTGAGVADGAWAPSANNFVRALLAEGTNVYAGGQFTSLGGQTRNRIGRVDAAGTADSWNPSSNNTVLTLALDGAGSLYAGGNFTIIGGQSRNGIAKIPTGGTGGADATWNPSSNNAVTALAADGAGGLYAGGFFSNIGSRVRSNAAKLSTTSNIASPTWVPNPNAGVLAIKVDASQNVYLGGSFTQVLGQGRVGYVVLAPAVIPPDAFPPNCQMPSGWTQSGGSTTSWSVSDDFSKTGICSLKSNDIDNNGRAQIQFTANFQAGTVSFWRKVSSEANFDCLKFHIDSAEQNIGGVCAFGVGGGLGTSGESDWALVSFPISAGVHTLKWSYEKDVSLSIGGDAGWIDDVVMPATGIADQTITFNALPNKVYLDPPFAVSATASSGLPVTFSSLTPPVCTVSGSTVTLVAVGTCTIAADQAGNEFFNPAPQVARSFTVNPKSQAITFAPLPNKTLRDAPFPISATASSGFPVIFTTSTPAICTVSGTTVTLVAVGTCTILADQPGDANYQPAPQVARSFLIAAETQTIDFPAIADHTLGDPAFTITATATSGLTVLFSTNTPSICTVSGSTVTLAAAGTCTIAANQPGDSVYGPAPQVLQSFVVNKLAQTITFAGIGPKTYGDPPFTVSATASSGLPVNFSSFTTTNVCTTNGTTITIVGGGTCIVFANQPGNANYFPAPQVSQSFLVSKANQTISFAALPDRSLGEPPFTVSATSSVGLPVTFSSGTVDVCTVSGNTVSIIAMGVCTILADQVGNSNYNPAPQVARSFTIAKTAQTITFGALANQVFGDPPFTVSATASSGLPVAFSSATGSVCTVSGTTVTLVAAGTCTINANQPGDATYNPAPQVSRSFNIAKANQTITFGGLADKNFGDPPFTVSASATSGLGVSFNSGTPAVCSVVGSTVTILAGGTCTVNANQAGNGNYNAAPQVSQSFSITKANQVITFGALGNRIVGTAPFQVSATASSGLAVTFSTATTGVCTVSGSTVTLVAAGTCTIDANQAGNGGYNPAPQVSQSFNVSKADQTITFGALADRTFGTAPFQVSATASSGLAVALSSATPGVCTVAGTTVTLVAPGTCTINANQAGNAGYNPAPQVSRSFNVSKANQTISFSSIANRTIGDVPFNVTATASSGLVVTVTSSTTGVCTISGFTVTLVAPGLCSLQANQAGDANYNAAPQVSQTFTVSKASQTISFGALPNRTFGDAPLTVSATASSGLAVTLTSATPGTCSVAGFTVTILAAGTCTVNANQAGNANYNPAPTVAQSFTIAKAAQTITFGTLSGKTMGNPPFAISATASSGLAVTFTSTTPGQCSVSGTTVTLVAVGTCTIAANQAGNGNFNAAPQVTQSFPISPLGNFSLTLLKGGTGDGTVTSAPGGIDCGGTCTANYTDGTVVNLSVLTDPGSVFNGWGGACSGTGACQVTVNAAKTVTATFTQVTATITVTRDGPGAGLVTSAPAGIDCGATCAASFNVGQAVTLTATPTGSSTFAGWSGSGCSGTGTCVINVTDDTTVSATFVQSAALLTVVRDGSGSGTVASTPAGIDCGAACASSFAVGSSVTLNASPAAGSTFMGWTGGGCSGTGACVVTMNTATSVTATFAQATAVLSVARAGAGSGTVSSTPAGIDCGATCAASFVVGSTVTLSASATAGSTFAGWSGAGCSGTGQCQVTIAGATSVTANFMQNTAGLTVVLAGSGTGTVTSTPAGIDCGSTCFSNFVEGTVVTLVATPSINSVFTGWSGACTGSGACQVTTSSATAVTATFMPSAVSLIVTKSGAGAGTVTSNPAGISCGATCSFDFNSGTAVTLTATSAPGSIFVGWGGACTGSGSCLLTITSGTAVTATFVPDTVRLTVTKSGAGTGTVTSNPAGISCGATCSFDFNSGAAVTLTATPVAGSIFVGWSGACTGTAACQVALNAATGVNATFDLATNIPRLVGISTRTAVLTGDNVMIGGFIIDGPTPKKVVVRARGPSLGVAGALANPTMMIVPASGAPALLNDDWHLALNAAELQASGFAPTNPFESAILVTLPPGAYTAIVSGVNNTTGVAIMEVFEVDLPQVPLIGISTRGFVQTQDNVMIGGFIIQGSTPLTVAVRARGPSLGVAGSLVDPVLTLVPASGTTVVNDNWQTHANAAQLLASGFAPTNVFESAMLVTLPPGAYTAIVTGANGTTGVALVEVYLVD